MLFFKENSSLKSQTSIGTIVLFIAVIFVATIAAGVLIQTSMSLQSQALSTGAQAESSVASTLIVRNIYGTDGYDSELTKMFVTFQVSAGSQGINLHSLLLRLDTFGDTRSYEFNETYTSCNDVIASQTEFAAQYVLQGPSFTQGYVLPGDVVTICFNTMSLSEGRNIFLRLIPYTGQPAIIRTTTPQSYITERVDLYP